MTSGRTGGSPTARGMAQVPKTVVQDGESKRIGKRNAKKTDRTGGVRGKRGENGGKLL